MALLVWGSGLAHSKMNEMIDWGYCKELQYGVEYSYEY